MDDVLTGADDPSCARELRDQLINLFKAGGCGLKKWVSNDPLLLSDLPVEDRLRPTFMQLSTEGPVHERGILRDPHRDLFKFIPPLSADKAPTKRIALAELARVFDPVGWLAPLTLIAKKIIQDLWRARIEWDVLAPEPFNRQWIQFRQDIQEIEQLEIPR